MLEKTRPAPQMKGDLNIRSVFVEGQTIRVATRAATGASNGPPLLICNGVGANLELLIPLVDELPARDIILFDVPGVGGSPAPLLPYRLSGLARMVMKMLDAIDHAGPVDVMGISWGGALAQTLAFHHRARVRKLILAATSPGVLMVPGRLSVLTKLMSPRRYNDVNFLRENAGEIYGGRLRDGTDAGPLHRDVRTPAGRGYLYQLTAAWGWSSLPWLWLVRQPTLILHGSDDPIVPIVNARLMAALMPRARLFEMDDGHLFMVTSAHETAEHIETFLSDDAAN